MKYKKKNEVCDHCKMKIAVVEMRHGFAYDHFFCPYCNKENIRK